MPRRKRTDEEKFIAGSVDTWRAGGYGGTVHVWAEGGQLKIRWTKPQRRQETWAEDTQANRRELVDVAREVAAQIRAGGGLSAVKTDAPDPITYGAIWDRYIKAKWPGIPARLLEHGANREEVRKFYGAMLPGVLEAAPSPDYLLTVLQAKKRLAGTPWYSLDRFVEDSEPGHWAEYTAHQITTANASTGEPYSLHTVLTDYSRLHTAIKFCKKSWPRWWGQLIDPLEGATVVKPDPRAVPEIGEERARSVVRALRAGLPRSWRGWGAAVLAWESGRRVGAIGADRLGMGSESLRAVDFFYEEGRLFVDWRAAAAKGQAYGRGDEALPATRAMEQAYRWISEHRPNPLGPEHPLIWSPEDPSKPVSYTALNGALRRAWKRALHDELMPRGLSFHGFCRTAITTIADQLGSSAAAEFTGRSEETVQRIYKRKRRATQVRTVDLLDRLRGEVE